MKSLVCALFGASLFASGCCRPMNLPRYSGPEYVNTYIAIETSTNVNWTLISRKYDPYGNQIFVKTTNFNEVKSEERQQREKSRDKFLKYGIRDV